MTWLKLSDDFGDDCARVALSDAAFRTHVEGLLWVMRRETGGWLDDRDLRRFAETDDPDAAVAELIDAGFWRREEGGYRIEHHIEHQPEPEVLARRRKLTAERVRRHRRKKAGLDPDVTRLHDALPGALRDALPGSGRDGSGRGTARTPTTGDQYVSTQA